MATSLRISASCIKDELLQKPYDFSFFQGIRLLEQILLSPSDLEQETLGPIRIKSNITLSPSSSDIQKIEITNVDRIEITINLLSLAGIQGPLPTPYTELVIDRLKQKDMGLNDFLDIFNHRLSELYYKIYKKYTPGFDLCPPDKSMFGKTVLSISGINFSYTLEHEMSNRIFLKYAGILWQKPRSLIGLEQILSDFFKIKVRVRPFQGHFEKIDEEDRTTIGGQGKNSSLGINTIIGQKAWITSSHLTLEFGPFDEAMARYFFKDSIGYSYVKTFVKIYCGNFYTFDIHLLCRPAKPLTCGLKVGSKMGWSSFIGKQSQETKIIVHAE